MTRENRLATARASSGRFHVTRTSHFDGVAVRPSATSYPRPSRAPANALWSLPVPCRRFRCARTSATRGLARNVQRGAGRLGRCRGGRGWLDGCRCGGGSRSSRSGCSRSGRLDLDCRRPDDPTLRTAVDQRCDVAGLPAFTPLTSGVGVSGELDRFHWKSSHQKGTGQSYPARSNPLHHGRRVTPSRSRRRCSHRRRWRARSAGRSPTPRRSCRWRQCRR